MYNILLNGPNLPRASTSDLPEPLPSAEVVDAVDGGVTGCADFEAGVSKGVGEITWTCEGWHGDSFRLEKQSTLPYMNYLSSL